MTIRQALKQAIQKLNKARVLSAQLDAEITLAFILKKDKSYLYAHPEKKLTSQQFKKFQSLIKRRSQHEPVAYLINHKEFFGLPFYVDKNVLIPRPETELMVEETLKIIEKVECRIGNLIDLGTGSGCVAIALAKNLPNIKVIAIDSSAKALKIAGKNARINNVAKQIKFIKGDLLNSVQTRHGASLRDENIIITANLPYISASQYKNLAPDIKKYEPKQALIAGPDGLKYYRELFYQLARLRRKILRLYIIIEIDPGQSLKIKKIIKQYFPSARIQIKKDLAGLDRIIIVETRHGASLR